MRLFILRSHASTSDPWEQFVRPCVNVIEPHLGGKVSIDFSALGTNATTRFLELLAEEPAEGVFLALCHGGTDGLWMPKTTRYIGHQEIALLRGKFCYLVACLAGKDFGPLALKHGARGFIGFSDVVYGMPCRHADAQRQALMSGLVAYLAGEPVPIAARALKKALSDLAHTLAMNLVDPVADAAVIGHLLRCSKLVRHGVQSG